MGRVDLDAVQARLGSAPGKPPWPNWWRDMTALVAELRDAREVLTVADHALHACRDPWYSAKDHGDPACPEPSCQACWRQEEEAREKARAALGVIDAARYGPPDAYDRRIQHSDDPGSG